ncbi:nitroreductase family deazaflavin-dependent oxidoreductase [Nocardia sp. ET3-3]|uniref:Nitroreductase family deazaflavin-dependent oxidoreductase n=1 Tax=Nocardia terrae TaxID=2675851 RepID=A0A7K1V7T6_9NOCA|nr:nitroreductase family deazaflavin-dependent oxidoreductase [Nocardia terrae]MVU82723.1 nitroreductase family deazaflavin-dependent oxidoreductase [Nocardia terrae]
MSDFDFEALSQTQIEQFSSAAGVALSRAEWEALNQEQIRLFRANGGMIAEGQFQGTPTLLLTTIGARSGTTYVSPLGYTRDGNRYVVAASKLGAPKHPGWFHNVLANPHVSVEAGSERFEAEAAVAQGPERDRLWESHTAFWPNIAEYQRHTTRVIPIVLLEPLLK